MYIESGEYDVRTEAERGIDALIDEAEKVKGMIHLSKYERNQRITAIYIMIEALQTKE